MQDRVRPHHGSSPQAAADAAAADAPARHLPALIAATAAAGAAAARYFKPGGNTSAKVTYKANNSPVTAADLAADAAAAGVLHQRFPGVPLLSEEGKATRIGTGMALVIDPIDGTRAFMSGRSEWCVSLALFEGGIPIAGVIHAPARGETFAAARGAGATLNGAPLPRRAVAGPPYRVTGPNRLVDTLTEHWPAMRDGETLKALAYRLVSVAAGAHDVALASIGANHWDIAAADVILHECGCALLSLAGARPVYNGDNPLHPALVAAESDLARRLVGAIDRLPA